MPLPHSTGNYVIGKGILYISPYQAVPSWEEIGNCPSIEVEPAVERLEHYSSRESMRLRDKYPIVETKYTVTFDCDEIAARNLKLWLQGSGSGGTIKALQASDAEYSLKFVSNNPVGPNSTWIFHRVILSPNGAAALIGDEWMVLSFTGEGLADTQYNSDSPYITVLYTTTTTTTSTTTTTTSP